MYIIRIFIIFISISLIRKSFRTTNINYNLPNSFSLLDNSILLEAEDGIHFFN